MRGAPHVGFSLFMRRIKSRTSPATCGRPTRFRRDRRVQNRRYPARCQKITVSGLTRMSASDQFVQIRRTTTQNRRSNGFSLGRGCLRLYTASCCRRAAASIPRRCRAIRNARTYASVANRAVIITTDANRFGMIAKLLIREAATVLMTHTVPVHVAANLTIQQVAAYRLMDNRSGDETDWNKELLAPELAKLEKKAYNLALT